MCAPDLSFALFGAWCKGIWRLTCANLHSAARIISNKAGRDVTGTKWNWDQVVEALKDPVLYFSTLNAFLSSVPNGYVLLPVRSATQLMGLDSGITTFGSLMYKSFGFTQLQVLLVGIPRSGKSSLFLPTTLSFSA